MMTLQREIRQMRCDLTSNSAFSNYHHFSGFSQESQRTDKFLTCKVYGEICHMTLEYQVNMYFFEESESENFYMVNYFNQSYNNKFNNVYDTYWNNHSKFSRWNNESLPSQSDFEQVFFVNMF
jgi:hypothetical protein